MTSTTVPILRAASPSSCTALRACEASATAECVNSLDSVVRRVISLVQAVSSWHAAATAPTFCAASSAAVETSPARRRVAPT
ncbi:hypothetical protein [Horticoccus sp. 23ND18S-11]|uniref:hypothetical protein n=1 Tax=Horticoccus sp. 23ND18S-11 TaxID=3391832 RepID=UPI0039C8E8A3